ncbi:hypothetical protein ACLB1N_19070 [Escherichia coli]
MYAAFSTSLQSACLSRQVGAALFDDEGNLLAVGKKTTYLKLVAGCIAVMILITIIDAFTKVVSVIMMQTS